MHPHESVDPAELQAVTMERDVLREEVERLREEYRVLLVEYRAAASLLRRREGEDWLCGADPTFGNLLRQRLAEGGSDAPR